MRETAAIIELHKETLDDAVREVNVTIGKSTELANKSQDLRVKAGQQLLALRKRIEAGEAGQDNKDWWEWARGRFVHTRKYIEKLLAEAKSPDPEAAVEVIRKKDREQQKAARAAEAQPKITADIGGNLSEYDPVEDILDRIERLSDTDRARLFAKLEEFPQWHG